MAEEGRRIDPSAAGLSGEDEGSGRRPALKPARVHPRRLAGGKGLITSAVQCDPSLAPQEIRPTEQVPPIVERVGRAIMRRQPTMPATGMPLMRTVAAQAPASDNGLIAEALLPEEEQLVAHEVLDVPKHPSVPEMLLADDRARLEPKRQERKVWWGRRSICSLSISERLAWICIVIGMGTGVGWCVFCIMEFVGI